jgi:predicted secreted protein
MSSAVSGYGTLLKIGDGGATETFTTIAEVRELECPGPERDEIDVTNHSSPNSYMEFIGSLIDPGEVVATVNWIPSNATHTKIDSYFADGDVHNFQIVYPVTPSVTDSFAAFVKSVKPDAPINDALTSEITLRVCGKITRT